MVAREEGGRIAWEFGIDMNTLLYLAQGTVLNSL